MNVKNLALDMLNCVFVSQEFASVVFDFKNSICVLTFNVDFKIWVWISIILWPDVENCMGVSFVMGLDLKNAICTSNIGWVFQDCRPDVEELSWISRIWLGYQEFGRDGLEL